MSPRRWTALALVLVASSIRCVSWPDDVMGGAKLQADRTDAGANDGAAGSGPTPDADGDAGPTGREAAPMDCPPQIVDWPGDGGAACQVALDGGVEAGASVDLVDSEIRDTGKVTVTCTTGSLTLSNLLCEVPQRFDLASPTACIHGFCVANTYSMCAVPNLVYAKQLCTLRGYAEHTEFTVTAGPLAPQCAPDGTACFVNENAVCNIVYTSVTCRH